MHSPARSFVFLLTFALVAPVTAAAQISFAPASIEQQPPRTTPPPPAQRAGGGPGIRAYFFVDQNSMAAKETFDAIFESSSFTARGGGAEVLRLWSNLFARVAFSSMTQEGSRVVLVNGDPISLGIPLTVKMSPLEVGAGWRLAGLLPHRIEPYAGVGMLRLSYKEESSFAAAGENVNESFNGYSVFGGVDVTLAQWIVAGFEVQYRTVPDAIGAGGVSQELGESDLGGTTIRVLFGIRR